MDTLNKDKRTPKLTKLQNGILAYIKKNGSYVMDRRNKFSFEILLEKKLIQEDNGQYILTVDGENAYNSSIKSN